MSIHLSAAADFLLKGGGAWVGALRRSVQWRGGNGDRVTWGSGDILDPALSIGDLEKMAAEAVAAHAAQLGIETMRVKAIAFELAAEAMPFAGGHNERYRFCQRCGARGGVGFNGGMPEHEPHCVVGEAYAFGPDGKS